MNYEEKKNELINKRESLMREYKSLFYKTMRLAAEMGDMHESQLLPNQMLDWMKFIASDEETEKFTRLVAALQYVESPTDKNTISNLMENIEINNLENKPKQL